MPPVRTLTKPVTPAKVTHENEAEPRDPADANTAIAKLPSWAVATAPVPTLDGGAGGPALYIGQLQDRTGAKAQLLAAGVEMGGFYLHNQGENVPLKPFKFWLVKAALYQTQMNASGNVTSATKDMSAALNDHHEHAVAVVLVQTPNGIVPAKCDFRKAQAPAYRAAAEALADVCNPSSGWPTRSDAHKVAAAFPVPFGRVVNTVNVVRKVGKGSGLPYFAAFGSAAPATVTELEQLAEALQSSDFEAAFQLADEAFKSRCEYIEKAIK